MINGVNFQPGSQDDRNSMMRKPGSNEGVQEAIKVLSLRLPKVVGASAISPQALLASQGSGGNPRVDSIVQSVLQKFMPTGGAAPSAPMIPVEQPQAPQAPESAPNFGQQQGGYQQPRQEPQNFWNQGRTPQIIAGPPGFEAPMFGGPPRPNAPTPEPSLGPLYPGMNSSPIPDLRQQLDWLPSPQPYEPPPMI